MISSKIYLFSFLLVALNSCGGSNGDDPEVVAEEQPTPDPLPDVFAEDYWDKATLVWSDEFDGDAVSTENWLFETGASGWGNNELQNYVAGDNVIVSDGTLKIIARNEKSNGANYSSTRMNSKKSFRKGRMEIRAKMPEHKGNGIWPAIWMLGSDIQSVGWPACGEIDIMEYVSFEPDQVHFSIHSTANNHTNGTQVTSGPVPLETIEEEFHNYGVLWTEKYLKFYIDDIKNVQLSFLRPNTFNEDNWPFAKEFYFLMNIAVGGNWGGIKGVDNEIFPATMEIDYVRVYQVK